MKAQAPAILLAAMLVPLVPLAVAEAPGADDPREFTYAGGVRHDSSIAPFQECDPLVGCPVKGMPQLLIHECDHTEGILDSGIHGIGGGVFCGIEKGSFVEVMIHDVLLESPAGSISCPSHVNEYPGEPVPLVLLTSTWWMGLADASPSWNGQVDEECMTTQPDKGDELTDLAIFFNLGESSAGSVTLEHREEG